MAIKNVRAQSKRMQAIIDNNDPTISELLYDLLLMDLGLINVKTVSRGDGQEQELHEPNRALSEQQIQTYFRTPYKLEYAKALAKRYPKLGIKPSSLTEDDEWHQEEYERFCKNLKIKP